MNKKNIWSAIIIAVVVMVVALVVVYISAPKSRYSRETLDKFAMCLAEKKITMYGAVWCSHCQAEKARFGSSFKYVPYVECPDNEQLCIDKGIKGYPTWITNDGITREGEQGLENLSALSDCPLE